MNDYHGAAYHVVIDGPESVYHPTMTTLDVFNMLFHCALPTDNIPCLGSVDREHLAMFILFAGEYDKN